MTEVPGLPADVEAGELAALTTARRLAVDAVLAAEELEAQARRARRRATARLRHYESLLSARSEPVLPLTFGEPS